MSKQPGLRLLLTVAEVVNASFVYYILNNKIIQHYLLIATAGVIVRLAIFKFLYPFPETSQ